jgi:hypothetical protein
MQGALNIFSWHYATDSQETKDLFHNAVARLCRVTVGYIHNNPVAASLVIDPASWLYSSACRMSPFTVVRT